jgi:hypothetical protein
MMRAVVTGVGAFGGNAWTINPIAALATDGSYGTAPGTLEPGNRLIRIAATGIYSIDASVTMATADFAMRIIVLYPAVGATLLTAAQTSVGTRVSQSMAVHATWYIPATGIVRVEVYATPNTINCVAHGDNTPNYLSVARIG